MELYCEVALGAVNNRNKVINVKELHPYIKQAQRENKELYRSYYSFDESVFEHMRGGASLKSFKGKHYLNKILFDIDKGTNKDDYVLHKARMFADDLRERFDIDMYDIRVWFSGRGYHFTIPNIFGFEASETLSRYMKSTIKHHFPSADLAMYETIRLLRVPNTLNYKTMLYKIPLSMDELYSLGFLDIQAMAKSIRQMKFDEIDEEQYYGRYKDQIIVPVEERIEKTPDVVYDNSVDTIACVQNMFGKGEEIGHRHERMLRMISAFRRQGVPKQGVQLMMESYAKNMEKSEIDTLMNSVYTTGYKYSCNDEIMKQFCDTRCPFYQSKNFVIEVQSTKSVEKKYHSFVNQSRSRILDLADVLPLQQPFLLYPKELIVVTGDSGLGKTALVQNIIDRFDRPTTYFNLELSDELLFRRSLQIRNNLTKEEVINHYKQNNNSLSQTIDYLKIVSNTPTTFDIDKVISETKPQIVVVDTVEDIEAIRTKFGEDPLVSVIKSINKSVKRHDIIMILIHHISKGGATDQHGKQKKLTIHSGKGNSIVEQKADKVIGIEGDRTTPYRIVSSLKARDEASFEVPLRYVTDTFTFIKD